MLDYYKKQYFYCLKVIKKRDMEIIKLKQTIYIKDQEIKKLRSSMTLNLKRRDSSASKLHFLSEQKRCETPQLTLPTLSTSLSRNLSDNSKQMFATNTISKTVE